MPRACPPPLHPLARAAYNLRWSWTPGGAATFRAVDPQRWELCGENPIRLLTEAPADALERAAADDGLVQRRRRAGGEHPRRRGAAPRDRPARPRAERPVSFFCAEYGIHASLPIYSGGLGALAGDILKEASDRALPLVAVGLLYRQGYFRQRIDASGWQHESWVPTDPERQPMALVTGDGGEPMTVTVPVGAEQVVAQIWRVDVGRVPLFLLDADRPENGAVARWISSRLYTGTRDLRLAQYLLLGVGGMRALQALGIDPSVVHLNEGHAAFASLELARAELAAGRVARGRAGRGPRAHRLHHAHAGAGGQRHLRARAGRRVAGHARRARSASTSTRSSASGRTRPDDDGEPFGVTQFALRTSRSGNGVSRRHGEVAREMWAALWPDRAVDDVPIGYVTNGVHLPTWLGDPMRTLLDRHLGEGWMDRAADPAAWDGLYDDPRRRAVGRAQRAARRAGDLGARAQHGRPPGPRRAARLRRGRRTSTPTCSRSASPAAWPPTSACTCCCRAPRGSSTCSRASARSRSCIAGKAHPRDEDGKRSLQALFAAKGIPEIGRRVAYLDDYDLTHRRAARAPAATCGSTCPARRWRRAAPAG